MLIDILKILVALNKIYKTSLAPKATIIKSDNNEDIRRILFYENLISNDVVIKNPKKNKKILIVIGPEGGFSENELSLVEQSDFEIKSLGNNILRAETAAICAVNNVNLFISSAQ